MIVDVRKEYNENTVFDLLGFSHGVDTRSVSLGRHPWNYNLHELSKTTPFFLLYTYYYSILAS